MSETQCWHCEREANLKRKAKPKSTKIDLDTLEDINIILGASK